MNVFDIIGPVMIGPSSSHTAGALRIGRVARALLGEPPIHAVIKLHGSFARTYKGHGTDKAIVGGLLDLKTDDENIINSLNIAKKQGLIYTFERVELKDMHPNSVFIEATGKSGKKISVLGSSIGGGNILIKEINGLSVKINCKYETLIIEHKDVRGVVAAVANVLSYNNINIAQMNVYRTGKGGDAIMVIETDQDIYQELMFLLNKLPQVNNVTLIKPI